MLTSCKKKKSQIVFYITSKQKVQIFIEYNPNVLNE